LQLGIVTFKTEILAPTHEVWAAISTTDGMKVWMPWVKVDTNWQVNSSIVMTLYDDKGRVMEHNGGRMIFNGVIEVKNEDREIAYSYPEKMAGIEKESYVLDAIDDRTTCLTFTQICASEEIANDQEKDQKQLVEILKNKLEEKARYASRTAALQ
jgi:uncharacterized protein YndB with AHSA1/START domain